MGCSKIFVCLASVVTVPQSDKHDREPSTNLIPLTEKKRTLTSKTNPHHAVVGSVHFLQSPTLEINEFLKRGDKLLSSTSFLTEIYNTELKHIYGTNEV